MNEEELSNYLTVTELSNIIGNGSNNEKRRIQRKIKKLQKDNINILFYKGIYLIDKSLVNKFDRIYKHTTPNPNRDAIIASQWDIFGDFVPEVNTSEDVLISVMEQLTKVLIDNIKLPLKVYYAIEHQPNANNHVHYLIKSNFGDIELKRLIKKTIEEYCKSNQYLKRFYNTMVYQAVDYFEKGKGVNFKNAIFITNRLITKGWRQ